MVEASGACLGIRTRANEVRRSYANFTYHVGSWTIPRRVIARVAWRPGELYPRVGFIVTDMARPPESVAAFHDKRGHERTKDQRGKGRDPMDAAFMPFVRRQCRPPSVSCAGVRSRRLPAHAGDARTDRGRLAHEPEGEADRDRREGREPRPLCHVRDGGGRHSKKPLRRNLATHRATAAGAHYIDSVKRSVVTCSIKDHGKGAS